MALDITSCSTLSLLGVAIVLSVLIKDAAANMGSLVPGPRLLKLTKLPLTYHQSKQSLEHFVQRLHKEYGPIVQVAPKHISVYGVEGSRDVFAITQRLDRPYPLAFFHNYETENLVSTVSGEVHQERRRPIRNIYSARVAESRELSHVINDIVKGLVTLARSEMETRGSVELRPWLSSALSDIMSFVVYGPEGRTNLVAEPTQRSASKVDVEFQQKRIMTVWTAIMFLFPRLTLLLRRLGIAPKMISAKIPPHLFADKLGRDTLRRLQSSDNKTSSPRHHGLMHRLYTHLETNGPTTAVPSVEYILSDTLDHFWAGISTTLDSLCPLFRYLSRPENLSRQERLRCEIRDAAKKAGVSTSDLSSEQLKQLPFLDALIRETLRISPPLPFGLERHVSRTQGTIDVLGHKIPSSWDVTVQSISMAKSPDVFDEPEGWVPERWIDGRSRNQDEDQKRASIRTMKRHFMAFGSGPRMCLGVNVAWSAMRGIVAGVYAQSLTEFEKGKDKGEDITEFPVEGKRLDFIKVQSVNDLDG